MRIRSGGIPPMCAKKSASVQSGGRTLGFVAAGGGAVGAVGGIADAGGEATLGMIVSPVEKSTPLIVDKVTTIVKLFRRGKMSRNAWPSPSDAIHTLISCVASNDPDRATADRHCSAGVRC